MKRLESSQAHQNRISLASDSLGVQEAHLHGPEGGGVVLLLSEEDVPPKHRHVHQMTHLLLHLRLYLHPPLIYDVYWFITQRH